MPHITQRPLKGQVIRATFSFNLLRNNVALQVENPCCAYYHLREQLVTQQNYVLQVSDNYNNPALVIGHLSVNKMAAAHLLHRERAASLLILSLLLDEEGERPKKRNRKIYMRNWISRREDRGVYHQLVKELEVGDSVAYKEFFRMTKQQFSVLVEKIWKDFRTAPYFIMHAE